MQRKVEVNGIIARDQLLTLVQQQGNAKEALVFYVPLAISLVQHVSFESPTSTTLSLLNAAIERRQSAWTQGLVVEQKTKRQRRSDSSQSDVLLAAKLVQTLVKVYAPINAAIIKAREMEDLIAAMDLACVALYVVCALEYKVRLVDLVVDNLLYQVAKKYGDMPEMLESASCIAACVHARLWHEHTELCKASGRSSTKMSRLMHYLQNNMNNDVANAVRKNLELLVEFPRPCSDHSAQFTRLLVGYMNMCVTLLASTQSHETVRLVAETTLSPWIDHLEKTSGQSSKLASSFRDRTFRILWKCAAALENGDEISSTASTSALQYRSTALTFVLKCSNYTLVYFMQQVYRVAVQHERTSKRSPQGLKGVCAFYDRLMNALLQALPNSKPVYTSESLQWEYLQWLEHYAFICEMLGMHLKSAMILDDALHYVRLFGATGEPIQSCLRLSVAGALFTASDSKSQEEKSHIRCSGKGLRPKAGRTVGDLILCISPDQLPEQCKKTAQLYLEKLQKSAAYSFESLELQNFATCVPFVIRCVKRSSTKIFNHAIGVRHYPNCQLCGQVAKSFAEICNCLKKLRTSAEVNGKITESLMLEELRLLRMAVVLSVRCWLGVTSRATLIKPVLERISTQLSLVRELLMDAIMDGSKSNESIVQGFFGDLKSILLECYACMSRCYKIEKYSGMISTLARAFELAQSYVEYLISCNDKCEDEIHKVYTQLKLDEMASLLAHCFRQMGDITSSRQFVGLALMHCSDIHKNIPYSAIDNYVSCILDETKKLGIGTEDTVANIFTSFLETTHHVLKSRGVSENQIFRLWRTFRFAFNGAAEKAVYNARVENGVAHSTLVLPESFVHTCGTLQSYLDDILLKAKLTAMDKRSYALGNVLLEVSQSLAKRKQIFYTWYSKRDFNAAMEGLALVRQSLTSATEKLQSFPDSVSVDLGGVLGWRGIIAIEHALIVSYAGFPECEVARGNATFENAISDIERCLRYWGQGDTTSGFLFDEPYMVCCLSSIRNTLSLLFCSSLETAARKLLEKLEQSVPIQEIIAPPIFGLFSSRFSQDYRLGLEKRGFTGSNEDGTSETKLFEQADQALVAAKISGDRGQTCQSILDVITILGKIKPRMRQCQTVTVAKAIGMREMIVHMILSEFYFLEGRSKCAIKEAKIALSICWKMAKKSTALMSSTDASSFNLPSKLSLKISQERQSAHLLFFMALESSSWDVLFAAKLILCRIAYLYILFDQPHRATVYLTEAMRLVGGLNLHLFRREPFYKYAELELNACHLENAKVAISLLTLHPTLGTHQRKVNDVVESTMFGYMQADVAFIEQNCNEIVQQGDLHRKEGNETQAATCYKKAIESLNAVEDREIRHSESFRRVKARSLRKYTQLHSEIHDFADSTAVEALLISMQQLEQSMETCGVYLERVKCMLELGRINVKLFRAASRTFISLDRTTALLEEAYLLGQNLGIPYLSQELRAALGMAYLAVIENAGVETTSKIGCKRLRFLLWMSSGLLANAGSAGMAIKEIAVESDRENVAGESFRLQLEHLAASSSTSRQHDQQRNLIQAAENIASQMQQLPDNWVIVSLMINLSSELVITRFTTNGLSPAVFCLPKADWKHFVCEMNAIIQDSREVLSGHTAEEASSWSIEQKQKWWATREALDKRIEDVMVSMQTMLGFWRCLLVGGSSTFTMENVQRCWELIVSSKTGSRVLMERNQTLLCVIADAQQWLSEDELIDGLKHIAVEMGAPVSDEIVRKALQYLRNKQANLSNLAKLSTERIAKLKVSEIKDLLEAEGLSSDGLKKVLIERLIEARDAVLANDFKSPVDRSRNGMNSQFSTILILHHELQQLPWEGLDIMTHCRGVTRMPSLDLILENVKRSPSIRRDRVRFLLNPAGDLRSTQHQLSPILERGTRTYGWEGIIGQVPDADMLRNYLLAADLYIYCGHGSGEAYLHRDKVLSCQPNCCAALLFGCSSGRLEREGIFGPNGAVLAYLRAGSPGILAMLWDVTDRDIDQLSVKVLQNWLLDCDINTNLSLAQVLQESRDVCKLKYLNGHAAICYGLPLYVTTS